MTFSDLYFVNNDWETSTVLEIITSGVNKKEELTASKALLMLSRFYYIKLKGIDNAAYPLTLALILLAHGNPKTHLRISHYHY